MRLQSQLHGDTCVADGLMLKSEFLFTVEKFLEVFKRAQETPQTKYSFPQTEAQEIGWDTAPLIDPLRHDSRLHHPRSNSEITKYMDAAWRQKEQENLQQ